MTNPSSSTPATDSVTFVSREIHRARHEEDESFDITRVETVHASGRVDGRVSGTCETRSYTREHEGPLDLARVTAARVASGWTVRP